MIKDLTPERLVQIVQRTPELAAAFSGESSVQLSGNRHHIVPTGYTVTYGTPTGSLTDMTSYRDGNAFRLVEVATNALDMSIYFDNVSSFQQVYLSAKYVGTSTHWVNVQLLDVPANTYRTVRILQHAGSVSDSDADDIDGRSVAIPPAAVPKFISASRRVTLRLLHGTGANAGHDLWVDYAALVV